MSAGGIHRVSHGLPAGTGAVDGRRPSASPLPEPARPQTLETPEGLRQRPPAAAAEPAASTARRVSLPSVMSAAKDLALPNVSMIGSALATSIKAVKQFVRPVVSSAPLQSALRSDLTQGAAQLDAHAAAVAYGKGSATWLDRTVPLVHSVLRQAMATTAAEVDRVAASASGSGSLFARLAAGQTGEVLSRKLVGPLIDRLPRQFDAIDARAVVPDQIVRDMNALVPGSGDRLRASVPARQVEIADLGSASNTKLAALSADAANRARVAAMATPLGLAGQAGLGLGAEAAAGGVIGGVMAMRQSVATLTVPDAGQLRALVASRPDDGARALEQLMKASGGEHPAAHKVPLFFAKQLRGTAEPAADAGQRARMAASRESLVQGIKAVPADAAAAAPPAVRTMSEGERGADPRTAVAIGSAVGAHAALRPVLDAAVGPGH
jgi:hypothetical protein